MNDDPIVAEVRQTREMLAKRFHYDVHALFEDLRERQTKLGNRLVPSPEKAGEKFQTTLKEDADVFPGR